MTEELARLVEELKTRRLAGIVWPHEGREARSKLQGKRLRILEAAIILKRDLEQPHCHFAVSKGGLKMSHVASTTRAFLRHRWADLRHLHDPKKHRNLPYMQISPD